MQETATCRRVYDHRIRALVCHTGDPGILPALRIPRSTAQSWLARGCPSVVSLEDEFWDVGILSAEIEKLRRQARRQAAVIMLLATLVKISGLRLDKQRVPDGATKALLLRAVQRSTKGLPLKSALRVLRIAPSRYHAWKRAEKNCELDDVSSCPRSHPTQLTGAEVRTIKEMATSPDYRHMPLRTLSLYAQRVGKVFASAQTWRKLIRERGWLRPRRRAYL